MPNTIKLSVEAPDEVLNTGAYGAGSGIRVQSSATQAGAYADISGSGSTPFVAVVTNTLAYTAYDPNGLSSDWYRTRFENLAATRLSDWSAAFQVGDETAGYLCSVYDLKQRLGTTSSADDELLLEIIREVSDDIEDYVGQWLAPRPTDPTDTMTLVFDVPGDYLWWPRRSVALEYSGKRVGIRSFTSAGYASTSQPDTGGTFTSIPAASLVIRPRPASTDPGLRLEFLATGSGGFFWTGQNTITVTGSFGPASVPPRIQSVALAMATRRYMGKETAAAAIGLGPDGGVKLLGDISPAMRNTLDRMRVPNVA